MADESDEALAFFGLVAEEAEPVEAAPAEPPEVCEVWPAHVDALNLFLACMGQLVKNIGMGGADWRPAQAVNVVQEARWQGLHGKRQATVARQYRVIEREALRVLNAREAEAARRG